MTELLILFILMLVAAIVLIFTIICCIIYIVKKARKRERVTIGKKCRVGGILFLILCIICTGFITISQLTVSTPPIRDGNGKRVEGSIAELTKIDLNGRKEWISIRGHDQSKPILLFLAGGPGGTHMGFMRYYMPYIEEDFVVINWDQPGSGKSFFAATGKSLTPEMYVDDGIALTKYLCERFNQPKIYLLGESWGSALGVMMIDKYPEGYQAFFGTGQMVAFEETEIIDYNLALTLAQEEGNTALVSKLEQNGTPPYYGSDMALKTRVYLDYLDQQMSQNPLMAKVNGNKMKTDLASSEYGVIDKAAYFLGVLRSFGRVYPQLYSIDLRVDYPTLAVPVYFLLGRLDLNAPPQLVEDYMTILEAPKKEIIWFENSGHAPWAYEREKFVKTLVEISQNKI